MRSMKRERCTIGSGEKGNPKERTEKAEQGNIAPRTR
jgi:hypothetical protein